MTRCACASWRRCCSGVNTKVRQSPVFFLQRATRRHPEKESSATCGPGKRAVRVHRLWHAGLVTLGVWRRGSSNVKHVFGSRAWSDRRPTPRTNHLDPGVPVEVHVMPSCEKFTRPRDLWERRWGDLRRIASWRAEALCCFLETSYFFTFSVYKTHRR